MYSGKRSVDASARREQKRAAIEYVFTQSFNDALIGEKVCRTEPEEIQEFLGVTFGVCDQSAVPSTFSGSVITDNHGGGEFQNKWCSKCGSKLIPPISKFMLCPNCLRHFEKSHKEVFEVCWSL